VVCTRNRGEGAARAVRSILASTHPAFRVLVVDQSDDDRAQRALAPLLDSGRVRYLRTPTRGLSRARNIGLRESDTEAVAFTDDDCEVPPDWLACMGAIFEAHPHVVVAFCNVEAAPFDPRLGFTPRYVRSGDTCVGQLSHKPRVRGMGAGMAVRRETVLELGGFDEQLGAGGRFPSCEDWDLAVRALLHGRAVYETDAVTITHFGFRTFAEGRALTERDWVGIGAAYAKPFKRGRWGFAAVVARELGRHVLAPMLASAARLRRPRGARRITAFLRGFASGLRTPLDPHTLRFVER
jgi:glycosyltransferase involved in cell wall biosynthesis